MAMPSDLNASLTKTTLTNSPRHVPLPDSPDELSHSYCTDHMVTVRWTESGGWEAPHVRPYENLSIAPTASVLHYATECFEGMKVYRGFDGKLRLFRPDCNGERMVMSARRACLPGFSVGELKGLIARLMKVDGGRWLPKSQPGKFLYLRPTLIANGPQLGVQVPQEALLFIVAVFWPDPSNKPGLNKVPTASSLKLLASTPDTIRAWPGGFGYAKLGANYGPSLQAHARAQAQGFNQILWLFGPERIVTEAGASNFFLVWRNALSGGLELVTPGLGNEVILPGVTRRSVLELARVGLSGEAADKESGRLESGLEPVEVVERQFGIGEVERAWREGRIVEAFVSGTAYFITRVSSIRDGDVDMDMSQPGDKSAGYGSLIRKWLGDIMFGNKEHEWAYVIDEEN